MPAVYRARLRARSGSESLSPTAYKLMIALLAIVLAILILCAALFFLRRIRKARKEPELPFYEKSRPVTPTRNRHRLTISTGGPDSVHVYQEKRSLMENSSSPPDSPVPEIRITFPEEVDESGKRQSGRVVVVRVGETSVGLEPLPEDLPPYQRETNERFQSLDLDRIGGLKEKADRR